MELGFSLRAYGDNYWAEIMESVCTLEKGLFAQLHEIQSITVPKCSRKNKASEQYKQVSLKSEIQFRRC